MHGREGLVLEKGEQRDPAGKVSKELEEENVYVKERGQEIQLHASCKERQRNQMSQQQSALIRLSASSVGGHVLGVGDGIADA